MLTYPKLTARNLEQLQCSVAHISVTDQDINNWKQTPSTAISYLFEKIFLLISVY